MTKLSDKLMFKFFMKEISIMKNSYIDTTTNKMYLETHI